MRKVLLAVAVAAVGVVAGIGSGAVSARTPTTYAQVVSVKKTGPTTANVKAIYRCTSASGEPGHLWVSIKQKGDAKADPALMGEGSSELAIESGGVWSDSHRDLATCDGKVHTGIFPVDQVELDFVPFNGTVQKGWAWVQFCLFDDNYPLPADESDFGNPFSNTVFRYIT